MPLAGRLHRGLASKVHGAVDQVRDYDRYVRDPASAEAILASFGYLPDDSRLAILFGRMPQGSDLEVFVRRKSEISVNRDRAGGADTSLGTPPKWTAGPLLAGMGSRYRSAGFRR